MQKNTGQNGRIFCFFEGIIVKYKYLWSPYQIKPTIGQSMIHITIWKLPLLVRIISLVRSSATLKKVPAKNQLLVVFLINLVMTKTPQQQRS